MESNINLKCSVCGKTITGNFQYIDAHRLVCGFCWETFYDGVRYLPASTRHKLQEALQKAAGEVTELQDRAEKLRTETTKVKDFTGMRSSSAWMACVKLKSGGSFIGRKP